MTAPSALAGDGARTLTLTLRGGEKPDPGELERAESADACPRMSFYEKQLRSDVLDERDVAAAVGLRRVVYGGLPVGVALALEGFARRSGYAAIVSWAERVGLPLAALLKAARARTPHVALFSWISTPRKAAALRRVHSHIHRLVLWSSAQYDFAVGPLGIPSSRVVLLRWLVDQRFWRPMPRPTEMVCAAGREMRDYATLIEAMRGWPVPCHIAANPAPGRRDRWMSDVRGLALPPNVTVGPRPHAALRELYARSRFVVVPLYPTDTDNGVTVITEAMAMGKAVICSRVRGQRDVLVEGVSGLFVPPRDPRALRQAMEYLWARPELCERMGREGRKTIERSHTLERFVAGVQGAVEAAISEVRRDRT